MGRKMAQPLRSVGRKSTPCKKIIHYSFSIVNHNFIINPFFEDYYTSTYEKCKAIETVTYRSRTGTDHGEGKVAFEEYSIIDAAGDYHLYYGLETTTTFYAD